MLVALEMRDAGGDEEDGGEPISREDLHSLILRILVSLSCTEVGI